MIKITVFSDVHFGFSINEETENDPNEIIEEIFEKNKDSDLIIICGDVFHSRSPKIEVIEKAISSLKKFLEIPSKVRVVESDKKMDNLKIEAIERHLPIITINGNHDRSSIGEKNILDILDEANIIVHLNSNYVVFEKDKQKISIFGFGNVPENIAKDYLYKNVKHIENCTNILVLHQTIYPYIFYSQEYSLKIDNLPKRFDVIINGHYHSIVEENINGSKLIMPGSLISTKLKEEESNIEKFYVNIYIDGGIVKTEKINIKRARKFFYLKFSKNDSKEKIENEIAKIVNKNYIKKPIVKVIIERENNEDFSYLIKEFSDKCILLLKTELVEDKKIEIYSKENIQSILDFAIENIKKNIGSEDFPIKIENLIKLLEDKNSIEKIVDMLINKQKTL
ncbi:MAG: metallophosphoesterase family protein [Candidatus Aenigmarchaeota archaeon]|nr:metallophosphoesterase family protein [Candidatus Aenigmarchaeota archaeon]MDW8148993.1 metallophosphoesterase family protein [Candidatus Aenigmarchaeota archaeon]